MKRPKPPIHKLITTSFLPAPELFEFIRSVLFNKESKLYNEDHQHLHDLENHELCFLWASPSYIKSGKQILGQCEKVFFNAGGWKKSRQEQQFIDWFGEVPKFLITLDAQHCNECSDAEFLALLEHELYHIAHAKDAFGCPAYNSQTGEPKLIIQSHDVEEFFGVVRRYGANEQVKKMTKLANSKPEIAKIDIAHSCGTCLLKLA